MCKATVLYTLTATKFHLWLLQHDAACHQVCKPDADVKLLPCAATAACDKEANIALHFAVLSCSDSSGPQRQGLHCIPSRRQPS